MLAEKPEPPDSPLKNLRLSLRAAIAVALISLLWVGLSRWSRDRGIEARARQAETKRRQEQDRAALAQLGGERFAILGFYALPGEVGHGQSVELCYSVSNAKTVRLEPQPNPVWPSAARCVTVTPSRSTTYTLTITGKAGETLAESLEVKVR